MVTNKSRGRIRNLNEQYWLLADYGSTGAKAQGLLLFRVVRYLPGDRR